MKKLFLCLITLSAIMSCKTVNESKLLKSNTLNYPETKKVDTVDTYFGVEVKDPYRWLEDDRSEETADWVKTQNKVTQEYLNQIPFRNQIKERLTEIWNYEKLSSL